MRQCSTELSLLDDHYLQVHAIRRGKEPKKYSIDLRFLNSQPVRQRRIAWGWFASAVASVIACGAAFWFAWSSINSMLAGAGFIGAGAAALVAVLTLFKGLRLTTESLNFTSLNGGATFVSVLGGLGSTKEGKPFFVAMIKGIAAAKAVRQQPKPQWLRDEMREHHRLRELGALTEADYEASKARILKAHA